MKINQVAFSENELLLIFRKFDKNQDGKISYSEVKCIIIIVFQRIDSYKIDILFYLY